MISKTGKLMDVGKGFKDEISNGVEYKVRDKISEEALDEIHFAIWIEVWAGVRNRVESGVWSEFYLQIITA